MRALTVRPGVPASLELVDRPDPPESDGSVLVQGLSVGLCGTDLEIASGAYGTAPPGADRLVLGHENLGRVLQAPSDAEVRPGDLVVGIVRRPDPVPCGPCSAGEWDMCRNGRYTEHGIKGRDGFARELWRTEPDAVVALHPSLDRLGVLLEPMSIVAKVWEQIDRIGSRAWFGPRVAVVTGAGPVGLLAALLAVRRGLEVHVYDLVTSGPKPDLVRDLGAVYHAEPVPESGVVADVLVECTGVPAVVLDLLRAGAPNSVTCLTGVSTSGTSRRVDVGALNREAVLDNAVLFGSVNANRRHYRSAAAELRAADPAWLARLLTRTLPLDRYDEAFQRHDDDVKVVLEL